MYMLAHLFKSEPTSFAMCDHDSITLTIRYANGVMRSFERMPGFVEEFVNNVKLVAEDPEHIRRMEDNTALRDFIGESPIIRILQEHHPEIAPRAEKIKPDETTAVPNDLGMIIVDFKGKNILSLQCADRSHPYAEFHPGRISNQGLWSYAYEHAQRGDISWRMRTSESEPKLILNFLQKHLLSDTGAEPDTNWMRVLDFAAAKRIMYLSVPSERGLIRDSHPILTDCSALSFGEIMPLLCKQYYGGYLAVDMQPFRVGVYAARKWQASKGSIQSNDLSTQVAAFVDHAARIGIVLDPQSSDWTHWQKKWKETHP